MVIIKNNMINWINFLHFYQPPITSDEIIAEMVRDCYQPWIKFLNSYKNIKVTINLTACLTERLFNSGQQKLLEELTALVKRGRVELVGSAAFHPILPLLPEAEIIKQVQINEEINKNRLGEVYQPQGFYLPEMAYSEKVEKIIKKLGYTYLILDEIALPEKVDNNLRYKTPQGPQVVFRNRKISRSFVPETIINKFEAGELKESQNIITATDGELYGHHYWNWYPAYSHLTQKLEIKTLTISEYLKTLKKEKVVKLRACSWETTKTDLKNNIPYALWQDKKNKIHKLLWKLTNYALRLNWKNESDPNHYASRLHLEKGLASCTFWWASSKNFKELFSPVAWNPKMVEIGAQELLDSIRSLEKINSHSKLKAEKLFGKIRQLVWGKHWKKRHDIK